MPTGRIRVSLSANEIEIEGDQEFIAKYDDTLDAMLESLRDGKVISPPEEKGGGGGGQGATNSSGVKGEFGEALHTFSSSANVTDQMLLAGSYAQVRNADNGFTTGQANQLLIEQGIKAGNPSQCMTNNLNAKRVFKLTGNKYRVSKKGTEHLKKLGG